MNSKYIQWKPALFIIVLFLNLSCKKQQDDFLNVKANNTDVVPNTLADFQAILDNDGVMNSGYPGMGLVGSDNSYVPDSKFASLDYLDINVYTWVPNIFQGQGSTDWNNAYQLIEYANIVLDGIQKIPVDASSMTTYNNLKGAALFYRAFAFYNIASEFCKPFTASSSATDLGIPIRLTSDINVKSTRATVQQTYTEIINDLKTAVALLPQTPTVTTRPSSVAANSLLAKVYLSMEDYTNAAKYANLSLSAKNDLMDYNDPNLVNLSSSSGPPFPNNVFNNPEIIFYAHGGGYSIGNFHSSRSAIDTLLYNSYDANDIRKEAFYYLRSNGTFSFRGTYDTRSFTNFAGIATDEIYLIRAECFARSGDIASAMQDLNALLSKRFVTGTFNTLTASTSDVALSLILQERRKELAFTTTCRWEDLRRLNKDPRFAITLKRIINGTVYTLPPNDPRYVLPIPDNEIQLTGMPQNPR